MAFNDAFTNALLGNAGLSTLSKAAGVSRNDVEEVISAAVPVLMGQMQKNASTEAGAASLAKALKDHAGQDISDPAAFLTNADAKDGAKIIRHILGEDTAKVQKSLAKSTGLKNSQISTILTLVAPLLLTMLGSQKEEENVADNQVGSLLGSLLGGSGGAGGLVGSLLGGGNSSSLLGALLGGSNNNQSSSAGSGLGGMLFNSLLGSLADDPVPMEEEEDDGVDLLSMLLGGGAEEEPVQTLSQEPQQENNVLLNVLGSLLK